MIRLFAVLLFVSLATLTSVKQAVAHPHEFVTMRITAQFDENGHVVGLLYNWTFDPFFTAYAVEGEDANKNGVAEQAELDSLLNNILGNIHGNNYFTAFDGNGAVPTFKTAIPIASEMSSEQQLVVTFDLPFAQPIDPKKKAIRYAVYDDEFYIAMTHDPDAKAVELVNAPSNCKFDLEEPDPDEDIAEFAASLGKNDSGGSGLGVQFAEWVSITCK
ncbi:MAG: DUF1007 family protein [Rhizobiaceae bacterium]